MLGTGYNLHVELTNVNTGVTAQNTVVTQCALHHFQYTSQQSAAYATAEAAGSAYYGTSPSYPGQNASLASPANGEAAPQNGDA